jgi:hypothetical protein
VPFRKVNVIVPSVATVTFSTTASHGLSSKFSRTSGQLSMPRIKTSSANDRCRDGHRLYGLLFRSNYADGACLKSLFTNAYLWIAILAILGCGKAWFSKTSNFATYMTKSSFGIYIFHYLVVLSTCYYLKLYTSLPVFAIYLIAIVSVLIISPALYELLRHIPILRTLILGIKKEKIKE